MPSPAYSELPEHSKKEIEKIWPSDQVINDRTKNFASVQPRKGDLDGDTEIIDGVNYTHHFVEAPGDYDKVRWHYTECGAGEPIVFLHGIPTSWYQFHSQMSALSTTHRCIGVDLKGYGQSGTEPGNYTHEGVSEQLWAMLQHIGVTQFNFVTHDQGTVLSDFIAANHPESVLRYGRGEQHLYHFNPILAPQEHQIAESPYTGVMADVKRYVISHFTRVAKLPIPDVEMERVIQEFWYPGVTHAVPRYFNSCTFRQEWLARRNRLLEAWTCPVMIMQGFNSDTTPREWYEDSESYMPNARKVGVRFIPGGHFWTLESPSETIDAIRDLLAM